MSEATSSFLDYWSEFIPTAPPCIHPSDSGSPFLRDFELSLIPVPFVGDLREAEAIILMLNPGLDSQDIAWEQNQHFRQALIGNLAQSFRDKSFPFFYLNPAFHEHSGAGYWAKSRKILGKKDPQKLRSVIEALALRDSVSEKAAQAHVSRKVAIVQLAPYHSVKLVRRKVLDELHSAHRARDFVNGLIQEKSKLVIAARSVSKWGFSESQNNSHLVVYPPTHGASASLTIASNGGRALLGHLSKVTA
jgi:hypothetical protein